MSIVALVLRRPDPVWLVDAAGEGFESGFGDEGVDEAEDEGEVVVVEFGDGAEAGPEGVVAAAEGPVGGVVEE